MTAGKARIIVSGLLLLLIWGLTTPAPPPPKQPANQGDMGLFTEVVERMKSGESYYSAMGGELRSRRYPTASVFNWRVPLSLQFAAHFPRAARITLVLLCSAAVGATLVLLIKQPPEVLLVSLLAQIAVAIPLIAVKEFVVITEAWAGVLIMMSIVAYARQWYVAGAVIGVTALFARELAAPYCAVCGLLALRARRWREVAVWVAGGIGFAAYFLMHWAAVQSEIGPADVSHKQSWVQFGGLPFVLRTIGFTGWYDALPAWSRAVGCVLLVASLFRREAPPQLRAAVAAFLIFFAVVGQRFNQYWGLLAGPAWALAYGLGVAGLLTVIATATGRVSRKDLGRE